jgi:1-acyl-sn-glycerol-3-phosphate acyltransferase
MRIAVGKIPYALRFMISLWEWGVVALTAVFFSVIGLVLVLPVSLVLEVRKRSLMHRVAQLWAHSVMALSPIWKLGRIVGQENIVPGKNYVVVGNHQSMMDIIVLLAALPVDFRFLAKRELFSIPFFGWHIRFAGYIPIDRSSRESGQQAMNSCRAWLRKGVSVVLFPEGTRSLDGEIQRFKTGAFKLAQAEGLEILPVVIEGTRDAIPKRSWMIDDFARFSLSIGKPVKMTGSDIADVEHLRDSIREEMIGRLERMRTEA